MPVIASRATLITWLLGLVVFLAALSSRVYYLHEYQMLDASPSQVWQVQGRGLLEPTQKASEIDQLVANCKKDGILNGFQCRTPLGPNKDQLAIHHAPLYPIFRTGVELGAEKVNEYLALTSSAGVRYVQALLGALTCLLYYIIAWRAFGHHHVLALAAGLLTAIYPLWIINVAELEDGVLSTFLLAWSLSLAVGVGQRGGVLRALLLGIVLAALSLTRAALLPFAVVVQLWFFLRCRRVPNGGICSLLTLTGFLAGLTPWLLHCYDTTKTPVPIVASAWFEVWVGNNGYTTGSDYHWDMKKQVDSILLTKLEQTPPEERYSQLAEPVMREITEKPWETCKRRMKALMQFAVGATSLKGPFFWAGAPEPANARPLDWIKPVVMGSLAAILAFSWLGWRWSYGWKHQSAPLSLALFWLPVCYILSHAGQLHSSRLPLDGVLIVLAAVGIICLIPGLGTSILHGEKTE